MLLAFTITVIISFTGGALTMGALCSNSSAERATAAYQAGIKKGKEDTG
jgi:hypothetical protein